MRKRSSVSADSRPPLKTLKSSVPRSNVKDFPRAAKIPRVHAINAESMDSRSVPLDPAATNENLCPTEHGKSGENNAELIGRKGHSADAACKETEETVV